MNQDKLLIENKGPISIFTINRPGVRNACDRETLSALAAGFASFEADESKKVAILTGAGGNFCAGADLNELASGAAVGFAWAGSDEGPLRRYLKKPIIAAVEGYAVAAGLGLAIWCDMRVASNTATFGVFCRRWGAPMTNGATVRLPRLVGEAHALDMLLTGRPVSGAEAHRIGLANRLVEANRAVEEAEQLALAIAAFPQRALLADRESVRRQWSLDDEAAVLIERDLGGRASRADSQAGARMFVKGAGRHGQ